VLPYVRDWKKRQSGRVREKITVRTAGRAETNEVQALRKPTQQDDFASGPEVATWTGKIRVQRGNFAQQHEERENNYLSRRDDGEIRDVPLKKLEGARGKTNYN